LGQAGAQDPSNKALGLAARPKALGSGLTVKPKLFLKILVNPSNKALAERVLIP